MAADTELDAPAFAAALAGADDGRRLLALDALLECDRRGPLPEEVLAPLLDCLGHRRKAVQRTAAEVLSLWTRVTPEIVPRLRRGLEAPEPLARWGAAFTLAKVGPDPATLGVLLETLGESDGDMRWAAQTLVVDLARRDESILPVLARLAGSGSAEQRKMALYCVRDLGRPLPDLREALTAGLGHHDPDVRLAALSTLAALFGDDSYAVEAVLGMASRDPEPGVRRAAVSTLGKLQVPPSLEERVDRALDEASASDDAGLRRAALGARRRRGAPA